MKTRRSIEFMRRNGVVPLVADRSEDNPVADELLKELGNTGLAIPFYAIFPADGRPPITFDDVPLGQRKFLNILESALEAAPSPSLDAQTVAH